MGCLPGAVLLDVNRNHILFECAAFVFLQSGQTNLRSFGVGTMDRLAVVPQSFLGKSFGVAAFSGHVGAGHEFGARAGTLLSENLGAETLRFLGEGRNRPPQASFPDKISLFHWL
jgi:hypothetical protein